MGEGKGEREHQVGPGKKRVKSAESGREGKMTKSEKNPGFIKARPL